MPRPKKCRKVCCMPAHTQFMPVCGTDREAGCGPGCGAGEASEEAAREPVIMTVDEYETIRLIDKEGFRIMRYCPWNPSCACEIVVIFFVFRCALDTEL